MNKIIIPVIVIVVGFSLVIGIFTYPQDNIIITDQPKNETLTVSEIVDEATPEPQPEPVPESVSIPIPTQTGLGFSVHVSGDMHDKSFLTISGTIPDSPDHLTGTIRTGEGDDLTIVYVFQIELEPEVNQYEEKVVITQDYLWEEDTTYIVSVNHGEIFKEVAFHRGTTMNNFMDSVVPIT